MLARAILYRNGAHLSLTLARFLPFSLPPLLFSASLVDSLSLVSFFIRELIAISFRDFLSVVPHLSDISLASPALISAREKEPDYSTDVAAHTVHIFLSREE